MRRLAFTIRADALETVLDGLLPLVPQGVHWAPAADGTLELAVYDTTGDLASLGALEAVVGPELIASGEEEAPDDPDARRLRYRPRVRRGRPGRRPPLGRRRRPPTACSTS